MNKCTDTCRERKYTDTYTERDKYADRQTDRQTRETDTHVLGNPVLQLAMLLAVATPQL